MALAAGRLRHRVMLQEQIETQDSDTGAIEVEWEDVAAIWAAIEPLSAREFVSADATQSKVTAKIIIRSREIDAKMRIVHGPRIYNIEGVLRDLDSGLEYITLPVSEGVNQGG